MTKLELYEYLNNPKIDYYTALRVSRSFVRAEPFRSRLLNHLFSQYKKFPKFNTIELMEWFIDYVRPIFSVTRFMHNAGNNAITFYKALWADSYLYKDAIALFKEGKPIQIVTSIDDKMQEVKENIELSEEERKKLLGQLRAKRMREAKARKREEQLIAEQIEQEKLRQTKQKELKVTEEVKTEEAKPKNPSVIIQGHQREMTDEELAIINSLRKLNT